ncbi:MAG: NADH-quinone oxidoreductase subunit NuoE [Thermodesulfobacteriota bacterium]
MDLKEKVEEIAGRYPERRSALLPALFLAQKKYGYLTKEAMEEVASILGLLPVQVYEVATFYTMFNKKPVGKFHVQVCTNVSCSLLGSEMIVNCLKKKLGIKVGETTRNKLFTLTEVECLGSCGTAPMMQINDTYYENLTEKKVENILNELRSTVAVKA